MDAQGQVRTWLLEQSDWLQEAADRLLKHGNLTQNDISQIASQLKTPAGQAISKHRTFDELTHAPAGSVLRLQSIAPSQWLEPPWSQYVNTYLTKLGQTTMRRLPT